MLIHTTLAARVVLFSVAVSVCDCLSVCLFVITIPVNRYITKFLGHHPMVEMTDKFESSYIGVRGWCDNVYDVLVF